MRVLVAEDDRQMSQLLCAMLQSAGHRAMPAYDGASAMMAAMRAPAPDLIVLDLQMPAGDGQTTLTKLKQSSKTALIPVIIVSATKDTAVQEALKAQGAITFLEKPVNPDNFIAAVEAFGPKK
jgi:DNA-binding response OmpR family regulator